MTDLRYTYPRSHRLRTRAEFSRVFDARVRASNGPLTVYAIPNDVLHPRLGIALTRKVGNAVRRNRIKRLLRETFRVHQHDLPRAYDFVVAVRPHVPITLDEYQRIIPGLMNRLDEAWQKRSMNS